MLDSGPLGFCAKVQMRMFNGLFRELQAQISHVVVDRMHGVEDEDSSTSEKTRINREHYLNLTRRDFSKLERM